MSILEVERRLNSWSHYIYDLMNNKIGWPEKSYIVSFMGGGVRMTSGIPIIRYEYCQQVDLWIRQMKEIHPEYADAIYNYYLTRAPQNVVARKMQVSLRTLERRLHEAKLWLSGRLNAAEAV